MSMISEFVEKLKERLGEYEYSHLVEHDTEECLHCRENEDDWCNCRNCFICVWDKAKAIVKELEDEYSNDLCIWFEYDYRTMAPKNHDVGNPYWRIPENMDKLKFCPYCGKKIKVM